MKTLKKSTIIIGLIILAIALLIGGYLFMNEIKSQNVFDEIYFAWADYPNILPTEPNFSNVKPLEGHPNDDEIEESKDFDGRLCIIYDTFFLISECEMDIYIYPQSKEIHFRGMVKYDKGEYLMIDYTYNNAEKLLKTEKLIIRSDKITNDEFAWTQYSEKETVEQFLKENNITKEEIEKYKEYFLYEVTIGSWVDGNGKLSKFTRENPGKFTIVDNTYSLLGEEWQER